MLNFERSGINLDLLSNLLLRTVIMAYNLIQFIKYCPGFLSIRSVLNVFMANLLKL